MKNVPRTEGDFLGGRSCRWWLHSLHFYAVSALLAAFFTLGLWVASRLAPQPSRARLEVLVVKHQHFGPVKAGDWQAAYCGWGTLFFAVFVSIHGILTWRVIR